MIREGVVCMTGHALLTYCLPDTITFSVYYNFLLSNTASKQFLQLVCSILGHAGHIAPYCKMTSIFHSAICSLIDGLKVEMIHHNLRVHELAVETR